MGGVQFLAMSPLENSIRLWSGVEALVGPASSASETYAELAQQLTGAADEGRTVHSTTLASWQGKTSQAAKRQFANHATWLDSHAANATSAATQAATISTAQGVALGTMPTPPVVWAAWVALQDAHTAKNLLVVAAIAFPNPVTVGMAVSSQSSLVAAETAWHTLQVTAGTTMVTYDNATDAVLATLPPLTQSPSIVHVAGGVAGGNQQVAGAPTLTTVGATTGRTGGIVGKTGSTPTTGGGGQPTPTGAGSPAGTAAPTQSLPAASVPANVTQPSLPTPPLPNGINTLDATYPGTSSGSAALAALSGGLGMSSLGIGMISGGAADVAGEATGFRLPANWSTTAAAAVSEETAAAEEAATAPRGATAPALGRRAEEQEQERQRSGVPISQLEEVDGDFAQPGVIEYVDDDD
jgi:hypothetical protein